MSTAMSVFRRITAIKHSKLVGFTVLALLIVGSGFFIPKSTFAITSTIWAPTTVPSIISENDTKSVELGLKFRSSVAGAITGVRFYKGTGNTGTHTGALWSRTGTKLAQVTFTNETASGWQQASFASAVNITANTTYVISYHAPKGRYSADSQYFASTAVTNGPLTALKNGTDGGNGVYRYGSTVAFPNSTYSSTNYWVEPVFTYNSGSDTTPPTVSAVTPAASATNVPPSSNVTASFSEALDNATIVDSVELKNSSDVVIGASLSYDSTSKTITLDPSTDLANGVYTATVKTTVKDIAGNALASAYSWSFTVQAASSGGGTDLSTGPGGQILVLTSSDKPFSKYYSEILRAEGLNSFASADIINLTAAQLNQYSVVVLGEVTVTNAQVTLLSDWVNAGGNLIAMRPDKKLAGLLGLVDQASTASEGYMLPDTTQSPGLGITNQTMQYHGTADLYSTQADTRTVASLYSSSTTALNRPAVTVRNVGTNGGQTSAFMYDLARSVVLTHQGNPAWSGQERDGSSPIRPNDLFYGAKAGDVQPDYIDLNKVAIPQADEQQRLLANVIEYVNQDKHPIPKFWYFPNGKKAVVVMAGDDHSTASGTKDSFDYMLANSDAGCVVTRWECLRSTSWVYTNVPLTNAEAANYAAQGFDLGVHVNTGCNDWTPASLDATFQSELNDFRAKYTSLPNQTGSRTHCIAWSDYVSSPIVEAKYGIRMDLNYYYWPGSWVQNRPGYFTGSGLNMRFANTDGSMIDVYQTPSHLVNESGQSFPANIDLQLDRATGPEGYYGALGTHYDYSDQFDRQLITSAKARGIPVVSVQQMLDWTDGRNASSFGVPAWSGNNLTFTTTIDAKASTLARGMLPINSVKGILTGLSFGGSPVSYTTETIKGIAYAIYPVSSGTYTATYASDTTAPAVLSVTPTNGATNVSVTASAIATFSEPLDAATVTNTAVELRDTANNLVGATVTYNATSNQVTLKPTSPLSAGTAYIATVKAGLVKDLAGNAIAANYNWGFTTGVSVLSLWAPAAQTVSTATSDTSRVELGIRFTSDVAGSVNGISFYKSSNDAATHTFTLWDSAGAAIGTAVSSNETASGWQTATFAAPIAITANTTYTASYTAAVGMYSYTLNNLSSGFTNGVLHALPSGGVFNYGTGVPTGTWNGSNYWVDVVFTPN